MGEMLSSGPIQLGDAIVSTASEEADVLSSAKARDTRDRDALRAQILATILNLRNDSDPLAIGEHIGSTVEEAAECLSTHLDPVTGPTEGSTC